jgi:hypothetical protein
MAISHAKAAPPLKQYFLVAITDQSQAVDALRMLVSEAKQCLTLGAKRTRFARSEPFRL